MVLCTICEIRKPRRYCPGVRGDICAICCGEQRERTVHCPLDCEYLQEARRREPPPDVDPDNFPNKDIRLTEKFLRDHDQLFLYLSMRLTQSALEIPDVLDGDVRQALDGLVQTYRTLQSGLIYQSRPANPMAAALFDRMQTSIEEYRKMSAEESGLQTMRDADILGVFAFLQRLEIQHDNGRPLGRAFIDFMRQQFPQPSEPPASSVIL